MFQCLKINMVALGIHRERYFSSTSNPENYSNFLTSEETSFASADKIYQNVTFLEVTRIFSFNAASL